MTSAHPAAEPHAADAPHAQPTGPRSAAVFAREQHFASTNSTNDVVAQWLANGEPEVCLAIADAQTHGRGREGRTWQAPAGSSLLLSVGVRPTWLAPDCVWQVAAVVALAMANAAEDVARLGPGAVRLKWPNDLVIVVDPAGRRVDPPDARAGANPPDANPPDARAGANPPDANPPRANPANPVHADAGVATTPGTTLAVRKLAGVLGETSGLGTPDPRAVIGIGINVNWSRHDFPADLADGMTSLRDAAGDQPVNQQAVLHAFRDQLASRILDLRSGRFAADEWQARQATSGHVVDLVHHDGRRIAVFAAGVDVVSGGLIVDEPLGRRVVHSAEILHVRPSVAGGFAGSGV